MSNYKIVRLRGIYIDTAINKLYQTNPDLKDETYQIQHDAFTRENISYPTGFSASMNKLDNDSHEIYYDCEIMQRQWAIENDFKFNHENWGSEILLAQLKTLKPDVVFFQGDIEFMHKDIRHSLKELVPTVRVIVFNVGYPGLVRDFSDADILLFSSPILCQRYERLKPYLVYHAFDENVLSELDSRYQNDELSVDIAFIGNIRVPELRYWMLKELLLKTNIEIWGQGTKDLNRNMMKRKTTVYQLKLALRSSLRYMHEHSSNGLDISKYLPLKKIKLLKKIAHVIEEKSRIQIHERELKGLKIGVTPKETLNEMYSERCHEPVFGNDYYRLLKCSNIVLNIHSAASGNTVDNMKMFESTGVGSCLLTDTGMNMTDLFEADKEVVTYSSVDEAIEKIRFLLNHENERKKIAKAGQARTLKDHTIMNRSRQIDEIIQKKL